MPATRAALRIDVAWRLRTSWRAVRLLEHIAAHVASAEGFRSGALSVAVVGARRMATLHARYLGIAEPTDVLAFDLGTDRRCGVLDGEVVLCADLALRHCQAVAATRPDPESCAASALPVRRVRPGPQRRVAAARAELALYLTHGVLHLAGYEDHTPAGFRRMHAREDVLLAELGLGAVFQLSRAALTTSV